VKGKGKRRRVNPKVAVTESPAPTTGEETGEIKSVVSIVRIRGSGHTKADERGEKKVGVVTDNSG